MIAKRAAHEAAAKGDLRMLKELGALNETTNSRGEDEFEVWQCTLVFDGEKQQTYLGGELIRDHAAERAQARRLSNDGDTEPE